MDDNMMEKLKGLLNDPNTLSSLSKLLNSAEGGSEDSAVKDEDASSAQGSLSGELSNMNTILKMKDAMSVMSNTDDPRIRLLSALKPYMREKRGRQMDKAIRMLQMTKMTSLFKDIN